MMTVSRPAPTFAGRLTLLVPCLLFLIICFLCLNDTMLYSPDSVNYLGWAHSLSRLEGFRTSMGPEPERYVYNAPLYPVLLAPVALAFPLSVPAAKTATILIGALTLVAFQSALSRKIGNGAALGAGLFLAINPLLVLYSTQVLSDIPFAACCVFVMILLERLLRDSGEDHRTTVLLIAAVCGALFLREVGIALVFAASFALLMRRKTRTLLELLIAVAVTYGLWYVRNEIVVARTEHPGLQNMALLFSHVFTASGTSPFAEITARLERSVEFYGPSLLAIMIAPFRAAWTYSVTDTSDRFLEATMMVVGAARWPLAVLSAAAVVLGARRTAAERTHAPFLAALVPAFGAIVAMYPVSDIRFLFPALLLFLWCAARGIAEVASHLDRMRKHAGPAGAVVLLALLAIPNLTWIRNVVSTNVAYRNNPEEYVAAAAKKDLYTGELMLIPRRAAEWIDAHSPAGTVVASKIKSAALWLGGRPLLVMNPLLPLEEFDNRIRDYGITFLICELQAHQVPDFAFQMALSHRYRFSPVFGFGDVQVFSVSGKRDPREAPFIPPQEGYGATEAKFLQGVYALAYGRPAQAAAIFASLEDVPGIETPALFYAAIAREFSMDLDTAETMFARFRTIPQSAVYLRQAQVHENVISLLRSASGKLSPEDGAAIYQEAAMSYWILGFRSQGVLMLREALRLDPGYFTGYVFGAVFSLAGGDTAGARVGVQRAERARPGDPLTRALHSVMTCIDSLPRAQDRGSLELAIGRQYAAMGLYEMAIDQALKALRYGEDRDALRLLADLYIRKERHAPSLSALRRLALVTPGDPAVAEKIRELSRHGE